MNTFLTAFSNSPTNTVYTLHVTPFCSAEYLRAHGLSSHSFPVIIILVLSF